MVTFDQCKDPYELIGPGLKRNLIVDGGISDSPDPQYIRLSTTIEARRSPEPLTGAQITLSDDSGQSEQLLDLNDGRYLFRRTTLSPHVGALYSLNIQLANGKHYQSTASAYMGLTQATDEVSFEIVKDQIVSSEGIPIDNTNVKIYLNTNLPKESGTAYLRWAIDEVYTIKPTCAPFAIECPPWCFIYQDVSNANITLVKTTDFRQPRLERVLLQTRNVDFTFMIRHYFNVTQYSMSEQAYQYWKKVQFLTQRTGSLFDPPPALVTGNIVNVDDPKEPVFGFFEVSAARLIRLPIDRGYIPVDITNCEWSPFYYAGNPYSYCTNPYAIKGSTIERPEWFF
jgi:hypothetical protein